MCDINVQLFSRESKSHFFVISPIYCIQSLATFSRCALHKKTSQIEFNQGIQFLAKLLKSMKENLIDKTIFNVKMTLLLRKLFSYSVHFVCNVL